MAGAGKGTNRSSGHISGEHRDDVSLNSYPSSTFININKEGVVPQRHDFVCARLVLLEPCYLLACLKETMFHSEGGSQLSAEVW